MERQKERKKDNASTKCEANEWKNVLPPENDLVLPFSVCCSLLDDWQYVQRIIRSKASADLLIAEENNSKETKQEV